MTTLTIIPSHGSKMARFAGSVAAGELVQVTIVGAADWISPDGESQTLRLRVVAMSSGATLAEFRRGETAAWTATGGNAVCTLNLNTVEMLSAVPKHARRPFLFVLDDAESHTLYFKSAYPVSHWPQRTGEDAPADLGGYRDFVEECKEAMRGAEGSALESAQHAAQSEEAAQSAKSAAESSALNASGSANLAGEYAARAEAAKSAIDGRNYINGAVYDSNTKKILLKNGDRVVAEIDATAFVKDGMVSSVVISGGNLVITFNTDAGQQPISIPITDIFDPSLYYTKTEADTKFAAKQDKLYRIVWAFAGTTADAQAFVAASANLALENVAPKTFELSGYDTTSYYVTPVVTTNPDPTDLTFVLMDAAMTSMLGMVTATRSEVAVSSHVVDEIGDTSNIPTAAAVKKSIDDLSGNIPEKATSAPLMAGTAAVGSSNKYASENHVHPAETQVLELYGTVSLPASAFPITYTYTGGSTSESVELGATDVSYSDYGSTWALKDATHGDITLCEFNKDGTFQYAWGQADDIKFNGDAPVANTSPCLVSDNMKVRVRNCELVTFRAFDNAPTQNSNNAVKSGGVYIALDGKLDKSGGTVTGPLVMGSNIIFVDSSHGFTIQFGDTNIGIYNTNTLQPVRFLQYTDIALFSDVYAAVQQIAPDFSAKAYALGELCTYRGVLYRCKSAYTAMAYSSKPSDDTTHWEAKKVVELFLPLTGGTMTGPLKVSPWTSISGDNQKRVVFTDEDLNNSSSFLPDGSDVITALKIAPAFSASVIYNGGELCIHNGALYRCTTVHSGVWDATHFSAATVEDVLAALRLSLSNKASLTDLATKANKVANPTAGNLVKTNAGGGIEDAGYHFEVRNGIPCIVQYT